MGKCTHHTQSGSHGEGVCSSCLEKKLNSVWRGESKHSDSAAAATSLAASGTIAKHPDSSLHSKEAIAVLGSIASITKRKHLSKQAALVKGRDITEGGIDFVLDSRYTDGVRSFRKPVPNPSDIIRAGHARAIVDASMSKDGTKRRSKVSSLVSKKVVGKSVAVADAKTRLNVQVSGARSVGCRSLPLVDRIAKETALRVIKEVGDEFSEGDGVELETHMKEQDPRITCFAPSHWQSKLRSKWGLKGLGSPITGSNKIFPSKSVENVQKLLQAHFNPLREDSRFVSAGDVDRKRRTLQQTSDLRQNPQPNESEVSDVVIEGMPDRILKPEDMNQRLRTSYNTVLKWLQNLPMPETTLQNIADGEDPYLSSAFVMEVKNNDLAKVGHLHQIAEEHKHLDESSVEEAPTGNHLLDVSSFGKFLIRAAQRKPKQGLSRVASAR
ncbi:hypothetical protein KC19_10G043100 [Ceratodon purpureus]|uniref:Uncharacterized protein n=1 Tax=Ceratodon purpureus TaxID=3225 RepID=A0A8T0GK78_CERPU|nr:hypothetical protein KC19_10G043100 [Ceratodon purpureus]